MSTCSLIQGVATACYLSSEMKDMRITWHILSRLLLFLVAAYLLTGIAGLVFGYSLRWMGISLWNSSYGELVMATCSSLVGIISALFVEKPWRSLRNRRDG